jgi:DNA-binding NarL/FixJ family response regulator
MGIAWNRRIRIFLVDDHPLLRMGLRLCLETVKDLELVGEAGDGYSAVQRIDAARPDVALIDVDMPGLSGIGVIRILRKALPEMKIIVLSTYENKEYVEQAMDAGADGYLLKSVGVEELVNIIRRFEAGQEVVSPYLANLTMGHVPGGTSQRSDPGMALTHREKSILKFLMEGKTNKEISGALHISTETVKSHIKNVYQKLKVKNRVEAARLALERQLLEQ